MEPDKNPDSAIRTWAGIGLLCALVTVLALIVYKYGLQQTEPAEFPPELDTSASHRFSTSAEPFSEIENEFTAASEADSLGSLPASENPSLLVDPMTGWRSGYFIDQFNSCSVRAGRTLDELVTEIEDFLGRRVSGYRTFAEGIIVSFNDGGEATVWPRRIDCVDPPYLP